MRGLPSRILALALAIAACSESTTATTELTETPVRPSTTTLAPTTTETVDPTQALLDGLGEEIQSWGISESSWRCVATGLTEGGLLEGVTGLREADGDDPLAELPPAMANLIQGLFSSMVGPGGCLSVEEVEIAEAFFAANPVGPQTYGSDPSRDMLYDGCQAGSMPDCDMLYLVSGFDSDYEEQALSCGGRNDPIGDDTTCILEYENVAGFDELAAQCQSGFVVACDALFVMAPLASLEEQLAATCGGARESEYVIPCWVVFGLGTRDSG